MGDLDAAVELALAAGTACLRLYRASDPPTTWREAGHGMADLRGRRTYIVLRPIPPEAAPFELSPDTEVEYLYDGGRRWVKRRDEAQWAHPLGDTKGPRGVSDPTWVMEALRGATVVGGQHDVRDGVRVSLDLRAAALATGRRLDRGRSRAGLLWRPRLRRWTKAVPARVWLDEAGRLARVEHLDPPWSRIFPHRTWNGIEFSAWGEPVALPSPTSGAVA